MEVTDPVMLGFIHYSEWIVASYGGLIPITTKTEAISVSNTVLSLPTVVTGDEAYLTFLLDSVHVDKEDLLYYCLEGDPITTASSVVTPPPYFVLVDHHQMAVTLLIRGTKNINEIVIDMSSSSLVWESGFVHEGIGLISKMIANEPAVLDSIRNGLKQNPGYRVKTVGHSLGAGIAALVAILWNTKPPFGEEVGTVECFAFASPPILTMSVQNRGEEYVHCLVNEDDIVPRLNVTCMDELMDRIQRIIEENESNGEGTKSTMKNWIDSIQGVMNTAKRSLDRAVMLADSTMSAVSSFVGGQEQRTIMSVGEEIDAQLEGKRRHSAGEELNSQIDGKRQHSAGEDHSTGDSKRMCEIGEFYLPGTVFYYHPYIGNEKEYRRYEMQKSCFGVDEIDCPSQLGYDLCAILSPTHSCGTRSCSLETASIRLPSDHSVVALYAMASFLLFV